MCFVKIGFNWSLEWVNWELISDLHKIWKDWDLEILRKKSSDRTRKILEKPAKKSIDKWDNL